MSEPRIDPNGAAVDALTQNWTSVLSPAETGGAKYIPVEHEPLLDMLHAAIHSSTGKTESGRSDASARSVINVAAFDMWQRIDGVTRAWIGDLSKDRPAKELKDAVRQLNNILTALRNSDQVEESTYLRVGGFFARWKDDIWAMFDPPITKEITATCPKCGESEYVDREGARAAAITAFYWKGVEPQAQCRRCLSSWVGDKELLELGYSIRANVDEATLREMGVMQ